MPLGSALHENYRHLQLYSQRDDGYDKDTIFEQGGFVQSRMALTVGVQANSWATVVPSSGIRVRVGSNQELRLPLDEHGLVRKTGVTRSSSR